MRRWPPDPGCGGRVAGILGACRRPSWRSPCEFQALLVKYGATSPKFFGSVARGTAHSHSDIDILVEMDPEDGNLLMRASGLMEETRALFGREDIDVFLVQLLKRPISASALVD